MRTRGVGRWVALVVGALAVLAFPVLVMAGVGSFVLVRRGGRWAAVAVVLVLGVGLLVLGGPGSVLAAVHLAHGAGGKVKASPDLRHLPSQVVLGGGAGLVATLVPWARGR
jgi:hypothetical protein